MKKILSVLLCACLLVQGFGALGVLADAADASADTETEVNTQQTCGENAYWNIADGVLTISGEGAMKNYSFFDESAPWIGYADVIHHVVIEEGITSIGTNAFCSEEYYGNVYTALTQIDIPGTVTAIHTNAISGTTALETVTLPASVTTLDPSALNNNYALKNYVVAEENPAYKAVDGVLFTKDGTSLVAYPIGTLATEYTVPEGTVCIEAYAFSQCSNLGKITFNEGLERILDEAFHNCDGLTAIDLPDSLKVLGGGAFQECSDLTEIHVPENLERIGPKAFDATAYYLNRDNWTDGVLYVDTVLLTGIYIEETEDDFIYEPKSGTVTVREGTTHVAEEAFFLSDVDAVNFSSELRYIGDAAFYGLDLNAVALPSGLEYIGARAFYQCTLLGDLTMGSHVKYIGDDAFAGIAYDQADNYVDGLLYYGPYLLNFNDALPDQVTVREGTTLIAARAFWFEDGLTSTPDYGAGMSSITFPESLTTICDGAFLSCNDLKEVTIPVTVTTIGERAFGYIKGYDYTLDKETYTLRSDLTIVGETGSAAETYARVNGIAFSSRTVMPVTLAVTTPPAKTRYAIGEALDLTGMVLEIRYSDGSSVPVEGDYEVTGFDSLTAGTKTVTVSAMELSTAFQVTVVDDTAYYDYSVSDGEAVITGVDPAISGDVIVPATLGDSPVVGIAQYAFNNCSNMTSVQIPTTVFSVSDGAFSGCSGLRSVKIPEGVTVIGSYAFYGCAELTEITLPDSVDTLGWAVFQNCSKLETVRLGDSVDTFRSDVFQNCTALKSVYITDMAAWCDSYFESHLANPMYYAEDLYLNDVPVTELVIPDSVSAIGQYAFVGCQKLTSVTLSEYVQTVGAGAFLSCTALPEVSLSANVTDIGEYAFGYSHNGITNVVNEDFVIKGAYDSAAEAYAKANGLTFSSGETEIKPDTPALQLLSIDLTDIPVKRTYLEGKDPLDVTGGRVTLYYNNETSEVIDLTADMVSGFDNSVVGPQTLTVTYGGKTDIYKVTIVAKSLSSIAVTTPPTKLTYTQGDTLSVAGMVVTAYYDNGTSRVITDYTVSGDTASAGNRTVTVTHEDKKATFTVTVTALATPTVTAAGTTAANKATWNKIAGATGYTVYSRYYKDGKWSGWKNLGNTTALSYTDTKATAGLYYQYTVRAYNGGAVSSYKASGNAVRLAQPTVKAVGTTAANKVTWNKVAGASGYTVYYRYYKSGKWTGWTKIGNTTKLAYTHTKAGYGYYFQYTVKAYNGTSTSTYKASGNAVRLAQPKVTTAKSGTAFKSTWTKSSGAKGYVVYRRQYNASTKKWSGWTKVTTTTALTYTDKTAKKGVYYQYTARAYNGTSQSTYAAGNQVKR